LPPLRQVSPRLFNRLITMFHKDSSTILNIINLSNFFNNYFHILIFATSRRIAGCRIEPPPQKKQNRRARRKTGRQGCPNRQTTNAGTPFFADGYGVMIVGKKQRPASTLYAINLHKVIDNRRRNTKTESKSQWRTKTRAGASCASKLLR